MWKLIGKGLAKAAIWCLGHPDEIVNIANTVKSLKHK